MVDTTNTRGSRKPLSPLGEAGAPEIEVTPAMIEAGERAIFAFGVRPCLSTADWAASLANLVYQAMEGARCPRQNRLRVRNLAIR